MSDEEKTTMRCAVRAIYDRARRQYIEARMTTATD